MHNCLCRTGLLTLAGYLQGTVQAFALQLYQALDLWQSKILLSLQFASQKSTSAAGVKSAKQSQVIDALLLVKEA